MSGIFNGVKMVVYDIQALTVSS